MSRVFGCIFRAVFFAGVAVFVAGFFVAPSAVHAATTSNLYPTADGVNDSASWYDAGVTNTCDVINCSAFVDETPANDGDVATGAAVNTTQTFGIDESSISNNATVTQMDIYFRGKAISLLIADADKNHFAQTPWIQNAFSNLVKVAHAAFSATVKSVRCFDGTCTTFSTGQALSSSVYTNYSQSHTSLSYTKTATSSIEIGINVSALGVDSGASISQMYVVITYTPAASTITVSGTVYSDEGTTAVNCASLGNPKVTVKVNGAGSASSTCTATNGTFSISSVTISAAADVVTVFLDNATTTANTITRAADTSSNITGLPLYQNRIVIRHEDAGPMSNINLGQWDNDNDADMLYTSNSGTFTGESGAKIVIVSGKTYTPGGNTTVDAVEVAGTYTAQSYTLTLTTGGTNATCTGAASTVIPLCVTGTFTASTDTVSYTGSAATTLATTTYYNLTLNQSGITFTLGGATTVSNDLTVTAGTLAGTNNLTVSGGDITGNGTINLTSGTTTLTGAGNFGGTSAWTFYNLTVSGAAQTTTATSTGNMTVSNLLTISASHTLAAGSKTWTLSANGTPFTVSGTFTPNTSTFVYTHGTSATITATTFYNLQINGTGTYTLGGATTVSNDLTATAGTLAGTSNLTVSGGDITGNGTINLTSGTTTLTGAGNFGGTSAWTFYNLTLGDGATSVATTATSTGAVTVSNLLALKFLHTLNAGAKTWTLSGNGTPFSYTGGATFNANTSTFVYTHGTSATITALTFYDLQTNGAGTYTLGGATTVSNDLTVTAGTLAGTNNLTVSGGDITGNGTINLTNGTTTLSGAGNFGGTGSFTFYNLTLSGASQTTTATSTGAVTVSNLMTVSASHTLNAGSKTWTLSGSGTPLTISGTLTSASSTFVYGGSSATNITAGTYWNVTAGTASVGTVAYTIAGNTTVGGLLTMATTTGVSYISGGTATITLSGSGFIINDDEGFAGATSTVIYTGSGSVTLGGNTNGNVSYYTVIASSTGTTFTIPGSFYAKTFTVNAGTVTGSGSIYVTNTAGGAGTVNTSGGFEIGFSSTAATSSVTNSGNWTVGSFTADCPVGGATVSATNGGSITAATLTLQQTCTLQAGSKTWTLTGSGTPFALQSGIYGTATFTRETSTVIYTGSSATTIASTTYYALMASSSGTTFTIASNATTTVVNGFTVATGTVAGTGNLVVSGGMTGNGIVNLTGGTLTLGLAQVNAFGGSSAWRLYNIYIGSDYFDSGNATGDVNVYGSVTAESNAFVGAASRTVRFYSTGSFISGITSFDGTVEFVGTGATTTLPAVTYTNLIVGSSTASGTYMPAGNMTVSSLTVATSTGTTTFNASSTTLTISGTGHPLTIQSNETFDPASSTVVYHNTSGAVTLGTNYYNLNIGTVSDTGTGITYTLGADTTVNGVLTIGNAASTNSDTLNGGSYVLRLAGTSGWPLVVTSKGIFNGGSGTVIYSGNAATNITATSTTYYNLQLIPAQDKTYTLSQGTITVNGNFDLARDNSGTTVTFSTYNPNIAVKGDLTVGKCTVADCGANQLTLTKGTGTITLSPTSTKTWTDNNTTKQDIGIVVISGGGSTPTINLGSNVKAESVTLASAHTFGGGSYTATLTGTGAPFVVNGTFNRGTSTVTYTGTATTTVEATTYYTVNVQPAANGVTYYFATGTVAVENAMTLGNGSNTLTIDANKYNATAAMTNDFTIAASATFKSHASNTFSIGGDYTNNGTFTSNGGTVVANGSAVQALAGSMTGSNTFGTLTISNGSAVVTFSNAVDAVTSNMISASTSVVFPASTTSTLTSINWNGQATSTRVTLRSSLPGTVWYLNAGATQTVQNVDVMDSDARSGVAINATHSSNLNSGNNFNWTFASTAYVTSGGLYSNIINTQVTGGVAPNAIMWQGTQPASTTVKFQFAASTTSTPTTWVYQAYNTDTNSCDTSSFYGPVASNVWAPIKAVCYQNKQFIRYRVVLGTENTATSAIVTDVLLNYAK